MMKRQHGGRTESNALSAIAAAACPNFAVTCMHESEVRCITYLKGKLPF